MDRTENWTLDNARDDMGKKSKFKGKKIDGLFAPLRYDIFTSEEFAALSAPAVKLLIDLYTQFTGYNNGDLSAAWKIMKKRGWNSRDTLCRALQGLLAAGFIEKTRQGGKNLCSLYAVTWLPIDECPIKSNGMKFGGKSKLDVSPTRTPSHLWRKNKSPDTVGVST